MATKRTGRKRSGEGEGKGKGDSIQSSEPIGALETGEFVYSLSNEGDGTVPLAFAQMGGVATFFVEESHGSRHGRSPEWAHTMTLTKKS